MKIFDLESKIESNNKQLEFYYESYDKLDNKFSFLILLYSFLFVYIVELFKFLCDFKFSLFYFVFSVLFILFLGFLVASIRFTYMLQRPVEIFYTDEPKYYYTTLLDEYKLLLNIGDDISVENEELLNEYINLTYLGEQESALSNNIVAYRDKRKYFYYNFNCMLITLVLYVITSSFVIFEKRNQNTQFEIQNYKEIINYLKTIKMAEKPKVDPKMIIVKQPIAVKQSGHTSKPSETKVLIPKTSTKNKD